MHVARQLKYQSIKIINNQGEVVKVYNYKKNDNADWYKKKQAAIAQRKRLEKKYNQWFGTIS